MIELLERDKDTGRQLVPYDTGKLRIGIAHIPKPKPLTADQERLQAALLERRTATARSGLQRFIGAIVRWL